MSETFLKLLKLFSETSTHLAEIAMKLYNMFMQVIEELVSEHGREPSTEDILEMVDYYWNAP